MYRWDGLGRRIRKFYPIFGNECRVADAYYSTGWQLLETRSWNGAWTVGDPEPPAADRLDRQHVWDAGYVDAAVLRIRYDEPTQAESDRLYHVRGANQAVGALVDASTGGVVERVLHKPYGRPTVLNGAQDAGDPAVAYGEWTKDADGKSDWDNQVLWCGYRRDPETGLYHVRHRMYHPTLSRWLSRDPLGYIDGPNLYGYCGNHPGGATDPTGLDSLHPEWWEKLTGKRRESHYGKLDDWLNEGFGPEYLFWGFEFDAPELPGRQSWADLPSALADAKSNRVQGARAGIQWKMRLTLLKNRPDGSVYRIVLEPHMPGVHVGSTLLRTSTQYVPGEGFPGFGLGVYVLGFGQKDTFCHAYRLDGVIVSDKDATDAWEEDRKEGRTWRDISPNTQIGSSDAWGLYYGGSSVFPSLQPEQEEASRELQRMYTEWRTRDAERKAIEGTVRAMRESGDPLYLKWRQKQDRFLKEFWAFKGRIQQHVIKHRLPPWRPMLGPRLPATLRFNEWSRPGENGTENFPELSFPPGFVENEQMREP